MRKSRQLACNKYRVYLFTKTHAIFLISLLIYLDGRKGSGAHVQLSGVNK